MCRTLALQTCKGWHIPNETRLERPQVSLNEAINQMKQLYPDAIPRSITNVYNCMGLVVASRRTWVLPEYLEKILKDDGYTRLGSAFEAGRGDLVVYHDEDGEPCHVGVVVDKILHVPGGNGDPLRVLSKWGGDGEYIHSMSYLPKALGMPREFWTDRKNL